jgi:hypothetical protein
MVDWRKTIWEGEREKESKIEREREKETSTVSSTRNAGIVDTARTLSHDISCIIL